MKINSIVLGMMLPICATLFSCSSSDDADEPVVNDPVENTEEYVFTTKKEYEDYKKELNKAIGYMNGITIADNLMAYDLHYDWGYGSLMHIRDVMGDDYAVEENSYDWYDAWAQNENIDARKMNAQFVWIYLTRSMLKTNAVIELFVNNSEVLRDHSQDFAKAYLYRAMLNLDAARMYEYLPVVGQSSVNDDGNDVANLTIPIYELRNYNNYFTVDIPRATREEMFKFILSDLEKAEALLTKHTSTIRKTIDINAVYGMMARLYMWVEDYANAELMAEKVISSGKYNPITKAEWTSAKNGFNTAIDHSWIMYFSYPAECNAVVSKLCNWTSWCSNETSFGYAGTRTRVMMSKAMYEKMSDTDWRKLSYKAPGSIADDAKEREYINAENFNSLPDYASLKFRPKNGSYSSHTVGATVDVPLMRIEEMLFISMEAKARQGKDSKAELVSFMKEYRDPEYALASMSQGEYINEILFQKRVEFWGEGINYFDYKRANLPVYRDYSDSNFPSMSLFNTLSRPSWMNFVFPETDGLANKGLKGWNNPTPRKY